MPHAATPDWERRETDRYDYARPCKVYVPRMEKYFAGVTWNISEGGALVQLNTPMHLERGERVLVGIAAKRRDALLKSDEMLEASIARALKTPSDATAIGLQFRTPIAVPVSHPLRKVA